VGAGVAVPHSHDEYWWDICARFHPTEKGLYAKAASLPTFSGRMVHMVNGAKLIRLQPNIPLAGVRFG
jgi:hypothetical protein